MAHGKKGGKTPPVRGLITPYPKGEPEPELEEREQEAIMRYSGAHLRGWHERLLDTMPGRKIGAIETPVVPIDYRSTSVCEAWFRLSAILYERAKSRPRAYVEGLLERPPGAKGWGLGALVGVGTLAAIGWFVALPAAAAIVAADSARKTRAIMAPLGPSGYPDLPEFRNDWARECFRFVQQVNGYHARKAAVERLRHFKLMPQTAEWYARLLFGARARLDANLKVLIELQPTVFRSKRARVRPDDILASEEQNLVLRQMLPIWDPEVDWLPLEDAVIHPGDEFERLRADLLHLESLQEAAAEALRDDRREDWARTEAAAFEDEDEGSDD